MCHVTHVNDKTGHDVPPKNAEIALWPNTRVVKCEYWVATISRLLTMIGLVCKRSLHKRLNSAKETYNFKEPTKRSHPIYHVSRKRIESNDKVQ